MSEPSYFQDALGRFVQEAANGGAIRHLAEQGYAVREISERLDFPISFARLQRTVWEKMLECGILLLDEPSRTPPQKSEYVKDYDKYGKPSFRKVTVPTRHAPATAWHDQKADDSDPRRLCALIQEKISENGEMQSYASCDFGLLKKRDPRQFSLLLDALSDSQREYVEQLPWEPKTVYHRLNARMAEIVLRLASQRLFSGNCYFLVAAERLLVPR